MNGVCGNCCVMLYVLGFVACDCCVMLYAMLCVRACAWFVIYRVSLDCLFVCLRVCGLCVLFMCLCVVCE